MFLALGICILFPSIYFTYQSIRSGDIQSANSLSPFISAGGTLVLVGLTAWYASLTGALVEENRLDREHRREEKEEDINALRRSLVSDLWTADLFFQHFSKNINMEHPHISEVIESSTPTIVDDPPQRIGQLTQEEVELIWMFIRYFRQRMTLLKMENKLRVNGSEYAEDLENDVTHLGLGPLYEAWKFTIQSLLANLPEDSATSVRPIPDYEFSTNYQLYEIYSSKNNYITSSVAQIIRFYDKHGIAKPERIAEEWGVGERAAIRIKKRCEKLRKEGVLREYDDTGVYQINYDLLD